jgi:uncharacterized membrane protein YccF (DUF307 family)
MRGFVNVVLNVIWLIFGGALEALAYALAGIVSFILISS